MLVGVPAVSFKEVVTKICAFAKMANLDPALIELLNDEGSLKEYAKVQPKPYLMIEQNDIEYAKENYNALSKLQKDILKWFIEKSIINRLPFESSKFSRFYLFGYSSHDLTSTLDAYKSGYEPSKPSVISSEIKPTSAAITPAFDVKSKRSRKEEKDNKGMNHANTDSADEVEVKTKPKSKKGRKQ